MANSVLETKWRQSGDKVETKWRRNGDGRYTDAETNKIYHTYMHRKNCIYDYRLHLKILPSSHSPSRVVHLNTYRRQ